jgi:pimeloyl-ACP methyl ester carboxylesterase
MEPTDLQVQRFRSPDGVELAWREAGSGWPFVLLHGLMGSGARLAGQGLVAALSGRGYRVILPDLRGHGDSGRPHDPACYPPDILADDMLAFIEHLGLGDFDLGGYSLGGKLVLRLLARGARPAHAVVGGQGLDALDAKSDRTDGHRRVLAAVAGGAAVRRRTRSRRCCRTGSSSWSLATMSRLPTARSSPRRFLSSSEKPYRQPDHVSQGLTAAGGRTTMMATIAS